MGHIGSVRDRYATRSQHKGWMCFEPGWLNYLPIDHERVSRPDGSAAQL